MIANLRQKALRGVAVVAIALAAGQFMQSTSKPVAKPKLASAELSVKPTAVTTVAAGDVPIVATPKPEVEPARLPKTVTAPVPETNPIPAPQIAAPDASTAPIVPAPNLQAQAPVVENCPETLDLSIAENAIINLTLVAACHPNERVVLKHAGLAVSAKTTLTGAIFTDIPALEKSATVEVLFSDGTSLNSSIEIPEVASVRRFAVQWQDGDAFQLHGFENGAGFDDTGDISGTNPNRPAPGVPARDGFMSILGDSTTENPLLAEVYTFPVDPNAKPNVTIEAPVTESTCGRGMLGETLLSVGGKVTSSDLDVAMPECDAIGDYLVLNNLVQDTNIASSE